MKDAAEVQLYHTSPTNFHRVMNYDYRNSGPLCSGVSTGVRCNLPRSQGYRSCLPWLKQNFRNTPLKLYVVKTWRLISCSIYQLSFRNHTMKSFLQASTVTDMKFKQTKKKRRASAFSWNENWKDYHFLRQTIIWVSTTLLCSRQY